MTAESVAERVLGVRRRLELARQTSYLSQFEETTRLLEEACRDLGDLLPTATHSSGRWRGDTRQGVSKELELLALEIQMSEALQWQAAGLLAGWAQVFASATGAEPAESYGWEGRQELLAQRSLGSHEWEA